MTNEEFEFGKAIIKEVLEVIKDESFPVDFREELKAEMVEMKDEIERAIVQFS